MCVIRSGMSGYYSNIIGEYLRYLRSRRVASGAGTASRIFSTKKIVIGQDNRKIKIGAGTETESGQVEASGG